MAKSLLVKTVTLDRVLKKCDAQDLVEPEKERIVTQAGHFAEGELRGRLPKGAQNAAGALALKVTPLGAQTKAVVSVPRHPFVFLERGSRFPVKAGATRTHRPRKAVPRRELRIAPRRFMARTKAAAGKYLTSLIQSAKTAIVRKWDG